MGFLPSFCGWSILHKKRGLLRLFVGRGGLFCLNKKIATAGPFGGLMIKSKFEKWFPNSLSSIKSIHSFVVGQSLTEEEDGVVSLLSDVVVQCGCIDVFLRVDCLRTSGR